MIAIAIIIVFILGIIAALGFSKQTEEGYVRPKSKPDQIIEAKNRIQNLESFQIEYPRHEQIFNESVSLLQTSNNINTVLSRYEDALFHFNWIMEKKAKGYPIIFDCNGDFRENLKDGANEGILRCASVELSKYKKKVSSLKTLSAIERNTVAFYELISDFELKVLDSENKSIIISKLDDLHYEVEDIYSDILLKNAKT